MEDSKLAAKFPIESETNSTEKVHYQVGSGSDLNSDSSRLHDFESFYDKALEDSFPASDPVSASSPMTSLGAHSKNQMVKTPEKRSQGAEHPETRFDRVVRELEI